MGKKPKPTIFRTTISVPFDLKERMDAAEADVNWSAIACRAFETKLAELASVKKEKTMKDVIQRLRASKQQGEDENYQVGFEEGRDWAKKHAQAKELERLARWKEKLEDWDTTFGEDPSGSVYGVADWIVFAIQPISHGDRNATHTFWTFILGDRAETYTDDFSFLKGFCEGALALWDEVQSEL